MSSLRGKDSPVDNGFNKTESALPASPQLSQGAQPGYAPYTTNNPTLAGMMRHVPVHQHFSGPACTFISVFKQPGHYSIDVNFRQPEMPRSFSQASQGQGPPYFGSHH